jgi:hypothetical protein
MELRRHVLKLRHWGTRGGDDGGNVLDLDWSWVRTLPGLNVGELRIHDTIGGQDNLRIFFFVGDGTYREPLPMIWILMVMQKQRDQLTPNRIAILKARRKLVMERFYNN